MENANIYIYYIFWIDIFCILLILYFLKVVFVMARRKKRTNTGKPKENKEGEGSADKPKENKGRKRNAADQPSGRRKNIRKDGAEPAIKRRKTAEPVEDLQDPQEPQEPQEPHEPQGQLQEPQEPQELQKPQEPQEPQGSSEDDEGSASSPSKTDETHYRNFVEGLEELQMLHGSEKNVHFYEYVMAMVLGARLDRATTLEEFVKFIAGPSLLTPTTHFNLSLELCDRTMRGVIVHQQSKRDNVLEIYFVQDNLVQLHVFKKQSTSRAEICFLHWAKNRVKCGDLNGVPLLLSKVNKEQLSERESSERGSKQTDPKKTSEVSFFIPDYGQTLNSYFKNCPFYFDKQLLGLSLLSTICSISCINTDLHGDNVCIYRPDLMFMYKWTIRISCYLFELSWKSYGMLATIDWEYRDLFPRSSSFASSGSCSSFSPILWEAQIGNFESYGLNLRGRFVGAHGMAVVLNHVISCFDTSLFKLKYRELPEYSKITKTVSSLLEVFPVNNPKACSFDDAVKARWNQFMSSRGRYFKTQKYITQQDISSIYDLHHKFCSCIEKPFYEFPSDLGKVILMKDGTLVAADFIGVDEIITYVPLTKCETFSNPRIWVGSLQGSVLKKAWPFCGFGGFAQWANKANSNCMMKNIGSFVALFATKSISKKEKIVCLKSFVERSGTDGIEDDPVRIKSFVTRLFGTTPKTRADAAQEDQLLLDDDLEPDELQN